MKGKGLYVLAGVVAVLCFIPSPFDKATTSEEVYRKPIIITQGKAETVKSTEVKHDEPRVTDVVRAEATGRNDIGVHDNRPNIQVGDSVSEQDGGSTESTADDMVYATDTAGCIGEAEPNIGEDVGYDEGVEYSGEENVIEDEPQEVLTYAGDWTVTFYCDCAECVGQYAGMMQTASGNVPTAGWTVAAGPSYPFGTILYIEGFGYYEVQDRGVSDGWVDIYVNDHSEIPSYGMTSVSVYIVG